MHNIRHIGLIPDGTRRWAQRHGVALPDAYRIAAGRLVEIIDFSMMLVEELSVYLLSKENLERRASELEAVVRAEALLFGKFLPALARKHSIRVVHAGQTSCLPDILSHAIVRLCEETRMFRLKRLNLLVGYDPLDEIRSALNRNAVDFEMKNLWVPARVDLVIRTGGGRVLLSNFLPLQCGYAKFFIVDDYFNDFTEEQLLKIYNDTSGSGLNKGR